MKQIHVWTYGATPPIHKCMNVRGVRMCQSSVRKLLSDWKYYAVEFFIGFPWHIIRNWLAASAHWRWKTMQTNYVTRCKWIPCIPFGSSYVFFIDGFFAIRNSDVPRNHHSHIAQWEIVRFFHSFWHNEGLVEFHDCAWFWKLCNFFFLFPAPFRSAVWRNKTLSVACKFISMKMSEQFFFISGVSFFSRIFFSSVADFDVLVAVGRYNFNGISIRRFKPHQRITRFRVALKVKWYILWSAIWWVCVSVRVRVFCVFRDNVRAVVPSLTRWTELHVFFFLFVFLFRSFHSFRVTEYKMHEWRTK